MIKKGDLNGLKVSKNFQATEWFVSYDYPEVAQGMLMFNEYLYKIIVMANTILQPARDRFGQINITSGFRDEKLNSLVGGSPTSQHKLCEAADIAPLYVSPYPLAQWIRETLPFAWWQLILYLDVEGKPRFVHLSLPTGQKDVKKKAMVKFGNTFYPWEEGICYIVNK